MKNSRRDFLKSTAIAGVGLGFGGLSPFAFARSLIAQGNEKLPPGILPVVIVSGSDFETGYQYGQQAGAHIFFNAQSS